MSLFRTLVDGISSVGNMVTANINPNKVQVVKPEVYDRYATQFPVRKSCIILDNHFEMGDIFTISKYSFSFKPDSVCIY